MPGGPVPPKSSEHSSHHVSTPPVTFANAGTVSRNSISNTARADSTSCPSKSGQGPSPLFSSSSFRDPAILKPMPSVDVVAMIYLLLALPQSLGCLVLTSYILSGSFKSIAGRFIAKDLLNFGDDVHFNLESRAKIPFSYYRSELLGNFLQLFSINSFILLVCHYSLPPTWHRYLIVLAKSIIASRLVGTYTTGSRTFVSVISSVSTSGPSNGLTGTGQHVQSTKSDSRVSSSSLANFITGFSFVVAVDYLSESVFKLNTPVILRTALQHITDLLSSYSGHTGHIIPKLTRALIADNFLLSFSQIDGSNSFNGSILFPTRNNFSTQVISRCIIKYLHLGEKSALRVSFVFQEVSIITNFAYLVLCIHVISLTISPYLQKIFILKDYFKTLDHLSTLAPEVPCGGFKKKGLASSLTKEQTPENYVVINMEQTQQLIPDRSMSSLQEINLDSSIADKPLSKPLNDTRMSISAENFKIFCTSAPSNKLAPSGSKTNHTRTILDRKRSNSSAAPSTTIIDKYFVISVQPIWTWIAAIKILIMQPSLFSGESGDNCLINGKKSFRKEGALNVAITRIEQSRIVFQVLDDYSFDELANKLSARVNKSPWDFIELYTSTSRSSSSEKIFISIFGLSPNHEFSIELCLDGVPMGIYHLKTSFSSSDTIELTSGTDLLKASLMYTVTRLDECRSLLKKAKKDESKKFAELRRQIETLKSKVEKFGAKKPNEVRVSGKLKGLQNSILQLENDIRELEKQTVGLESTNEHFDDDYRNEEAKLKTQITELEVYIEEYEKNTTKLRRDMKSVEGDKQITEAKYKKLEAKLSSRTDELNKLNGEIKALKTSFITRIQKRQRKIQERFEIILDSIADALEQLEAEEGVLADGKALKKEPQIHHFP